MLKTTEAATQKETPKKIQDTVDLVIRISITLCILLIVYFLCNVINTKKDVLYRFNQSQMDANSIKLQDAARNCIETFYDDLVTNNHYGIGGGSGSSSGSGGSSGGSGGSSSGSAGFTVVDANIVINSSTLDGSVPEINQMFNKMASKCAISTAALVKVSNQASLESVYENYKTILDAYSNCNSLFALQSERLPFPIVECVLYAMILLISLYALYLVADQFEPVKNWDNYDFTLQCQKVAGKNLTRTEQVSHLDKNDKEKLVQITKDYNIKYTPRPGMPDSNNELRQGTIKIIGCAILVTVVGLFIGVLENNTVSYQNSLYTNFGSTASCAPS